MTSNELRRSFLEFFRERGHEVVPSSPLVPGNDPTLLFTNAGMVQFKDVFLGEDKRSYDRAVTSQRCVRAGGKHNDLENVGYTSRHHTFFEMLGNFSFGDYFKEDLPSSSPGTFWSARYGLPEEKLWVTVFEERRRSRRHLAEEDRRSTRPRFTPHRERRTTSGQMGDTGPCGPCSEIFYDHGPDVEGRTSRLARRATATVTWRSGTSSSCSSIRSDQRRDDTAAETVGRHRHGPRAHCRRDAGRAQQLPH